MARIDRFHLAIANNFAIHEPRTESNMSRSSERAGLHPVDTHFAEEFIGIAKHVIELLTCAIEGDLAFFLGHIKAETRLAHCVRVSRAMSSAVEYGRGFTL